MRRQERPGCISHGDQENFKGKLALSSALENGEGFEGDCRELRSDC
jgi:hypothetical protein